MCRIWHIIHKKNINMLNMAYQFKKGAEMKEINIPEMQPLPPIRSMSEPTLDKNGRTKAENDDLKRIIKGMENEDYNELIRLLPDDCLWDELFRRNTKMLQRINQIEEVIGVNMDDIMPIPIQTWEEIKSRYKDIEKKYKRIRQLGGNVN